MVRSYSTKEVAQMVGISRRTLVRWLSERKISSPRKISMVGVEVRIWTARDVERLRRYKKVNYWKKKVRK